MCCICFRASDPTIPLNYPGAKKDVKKGIIQLAKKPIDTISIEIQNQEVIFQVLVQNETAAKIHKLAKAFVNISEDSVDLFHQQIEKIRDADAQLQKRFGGQSGASLYEFTEGGRAKVSVTDCDDQTHCSTKVAAALQHLFWFFIDIGSAASSAPGTVSSSQGAFIFDTGTPIEGA